MGPKTFKLQNNGVCRLENCRLIDSRLIDSRLIDSRLMGAADLETAD
jgi:hypothetical protein